MGAEAGLGLGCGGPWFHQKPPGLEWGSLKDGEVRCDFTEFCWAPENIKVALAAAQDSTCSRKWGCTQPLPSPHPPPPLAQFPSLPSPS